MKSVVEGSETLHARRVIASQKSAGSSDEAIYRMIERRLVELAATGDVLDFGAGTGQLTIRLHETGRYRSMTGADLYPRAADLPPAVSWIEGDLNDRLPIPPASFDVVVAAEVRAPGESAFGLSRAISFVASGRSCAALDPEQRKLARDRSLADTGSLRGIRGHLLSCAHHGAGPEGSRTGAPGGWLRFSQIHVHGRRRYPGVAGPSVAVGARAGARGLRFE